MADYDTKAVKVGGVTITVSKEVKDNAGDRLVALLKFLAKWMHAGKPPEGGIDNTLPGPGRPVDPGYGKPEGGRPDNTLPGEGKPPAGGGGRPDQGLPGQQPGIDNSLPGDWIRDHADEIAKAVLKNCFDCNTAQPHK